MSALCISCHQLFDKPGVNYQYSIPDSLNDGLEVSSIEKEGLKKEYIVQMTNQIITDEYKNIHSVVVVKNNKLVYENYFNGYDREILHNLYSASKSFTSALVGIAIDNGFIPDTNAKVLPYFPEYTPVENNNSEKQGITIRHLLTMSSGLACDDWNESSPGRENNLYKQKDILKYLWNLPLITSPGSNPSYCSGGAITLSNIISKSTGQNYTDFAKATILDPLGITKYDWNYREKNRHDRPDQIYLRPRDMAKFGMVYLNGGKWKNRQIIPKLWVDASLQPKVKLGGLDYGFLWWMHPGTINGKQTYVYNASGNGGQFIFVIPELNMVVAMTGGNLDSSYTNQGLSILFNYIIPANIYKP
ncbi:MAG: serine hydrolase [Sporocytophaga sp.]|nr:serine hydrolase [Sporocytophaga sp.]